MNEIETIHQFPALDGILLKIIPPEPNSFLYEGFIIPELMDLAMECDNTIDAAQISNIVQSLMWPEGPCITVTLNVTNQEWSDFKNSVIRKDKFLNKFFNKNKLRKKHLLQIHQWLEIYPSLFAGDETLKLEWYEEIKKFLDDKKFQEELLMQDPPIVCLSTPSRYDYYDIEAKLHVIHTMEVLLKRILVGYIQTYHPFLQKAYQLL
jgi:hypothetical protein